MKYLKGIFLSEAPKKETPTKPEPEVEELDPEESDDTPDYQLNDDENDDEEDTDDPTPDDAEDDEEDTTDEDPAEGNTDDTEDEEEDPNYQLDDEEGTDETEDTTDPPEEGIGDTPAADTPEDENNKDDNKKKLVLFDEYQALFDTLENFIDSFKIIPPQIKEVQIDLIQYIENTALDIRKKLFYILSEAFSGMEYNKLLTIFQLMKVKLTSLTELLEILFQEYEKNKQ